MPFSVIPFMLLLIPILEIAAFVVIGGQVVVLMTLAMILITAIVGSILLRWQGFQILHQFQAESQAGKVPSKQMVHGAMILVAGVLLLTPGFITDSIGFLLFVPGIRNVIWSFMSSKIKIATFGSADGFSHMSGQSPFDGFGNDNRRNDNPDIVDLDPDEFSDNPNPNSPWGEGDDKNFIGDR